MGGEMMENILTLLYRDEYAMMLNVHAPKGTTINETNGSEKERGVIE